MLLCYFNENPREEHAHDEERKPNEDRVERDVIDERESDVVDAPALKNVPPLTLLIREADRLGAKCCAGAESLFIPCTSSP